MLLISIGKFVMFWNLSFLFKKDIKSHNILCLMLDLKFKNICLIIFFIGYEKGVSIVEEYDRQSIYPMFLKCYHYLHPMAKF